MTSEVSQYENVLQTLIVQPQTLSGPGFLKMLLPAPNNVLIF